MTEQHAAQSCPPSLESDDERAPFAARTRRAAAGSIRRGGQAGGSAALGEAARVALRHFLGVALCLGAVGCTHWRAPLRALNDQDAAQLLDVEAEVLTQTALVRALEEELARSEKSASLERAEPTAAEALEHERRARLAVAEARRSCALLRFREQLAALTQAGAEQGDGAPTGDGAGQHRDCDERVAEATRRADEASAAWRERRTRAARAQAAQRASIDLGATTYLE